LRENLLIEWDHVRFKEVLYHILKERVLSNGNDKQTRKYGALLEELLNPVTKIE